MPVRARKHPNRNKPKQKKPKRKKPKRKKPTAKAAGKQIKKVRGEWGADPVALEYLMAHYALQGLNANSIWRLLKKDVDQRGEAVAPERLIQSTIQTTVKRAYQRGIIALRTTERTEIAECLAECYKPRSGITIDFRVADDDIGMRHSAMQSPFFWELAADAFARCVERLLRDQPADKEKIVIGNTGGVSVSRMARQFAARPVAPEFQNEHGRRLIFLSLSAAGSSRSFHTHSNYVSTMLAQAYEAEHCAVVDDMPPEDVKEYDELVRGMDLIVSGLGGANSYLTGWMDDHDVPRLKFPRQMIGDLFLNPIVRSHRGDAGQLAPFEPVQAEKLKALRLRPTFKEVEAAGLAGNQEPRTRSLVIVIEHRNKQGNPIEDKADVLDAMLRAGCITDCVLGSELAGRLLNKNNKTPPERLLPDKKKRSPLVKKP